MTARKPARLGPSEQRIGHLIVTHEVTNQGHDRDLLTRMATQANAVLQREDLHILADKGYFSALEILACHKAGITATVPRSDTSGARSKGIL